MVKKKQHELSGKNNGRINTSSPTNNEGTAAWANTEYVSSDCNVSIPSEANVESAKNWVDNGSRL